MASSVTIKGSPGNTMLDSLKDDGISSESSEPEKRLDALSKEPDKSAQEEEYVTGIRLALVLGSLTVTYFLMMLDATILATVSSTSRLLQDESPS